MNAAVASLLKNNRCPLMTADAMAAPVKPVFKHLDLAKGRIHEWFLTNEGMEDHMAWCPPLTVMTTIAAHAAGARGRVVWIGRHCWPVFQLVHAMASEESPALLKRSVFLDPKSDEERFWAIGQVLRCAGIGAVIADASRMTQTISRRLQLSAESGKVLGLLARPPWEVQEPTYAATRWQVRANKGDAPGWVIELLSCRGQQLGQDAPPNWTAAWEYQVFRGIGTLHLSPGMGCGLAASPVEAARSRTA